MAQAFIFSWRRRLAVMLVAVLAGQFAPGSSPGGILPLTPVNVFADENGNDSRTFLRRDSIYSPVGVVLTDNPQLPMVDGTTGKSVNAYAGRGTGFMVSPCVMATASHVVFGTKPRSRTTTDVSVTFLAGVPMRKFVGRILQAGIDGELGSHDWAFVEFRGKDCAGRSADIGFFDFDDTSPKQFLGRRVSSAGFPSERLPNEIAVQPICSVRAILDVVGTFATSCSSRGGNSGSPILIEGASGVPVAIGIISQDINPADKVTRYDPRNLNATVAEPLGQALADCPPTKNLIERDRANFARSGGVNPLELRLRAKEVSPLFATDNR
jgi:trypsin-like peptidase